jgi:hypothetical protein
MRLRTTLMATLGSVAGLAVAVTTYQSQAPVDQPRVSAARRPADTSAMTHPPRDVVLWMPCAAGSHLRGHACVHVAHRVTVVAPAVHSALAVSARRAAPVTPARAATQHDGRTADHAAQPDEHESDGPEDDHDEPDD